MGGFKFKASSINFPITMDDDVGNEVLVKTYTIDVGREDFLRSVVDRGRKVVAEVEAGTGIGIDKSIESMREFIDAIFGAGEFNFLYDKFGKNLFAMFELVRCVSKEIESKWSERTAAYQ
jgi:hypothetical protein